MFDETSTRSVHFVPSNIAREFNAMPLGFMIEPGIPTFEKMLRKLALGKCTDIGLEIP